LLMHTGHLLGHAGDDRDTIARPPGGA